MIELKSLLASVISWREVIFVAPKLFDLSVIEKSLLRAIVVLGILAVATVSRDVGVYLTCGLLIKS